MSPAGARLWAAAAACALLGPGLALHGKRFLACDIRCCAFTPSCEAATSMSCDCPRTDKINLRADYIPNTVNDVKITGASIVTIASKTIYALHDLRAITIRDVDSLEVLSDGLSVAASSALQMVRVAHVRQVQFNRDALSGRWPEETEITLRSIDHLRLERLALHFESSSRGPQVLLEHVSALSAERDAFHATVGQLSLVNVSLAVCQPDTFRGTVANLELLGCRLQSMESHCVRAGPGWSRVALRSCRVGDMHREALSGQVKAVVLEACNVTTLHEEALQLEVDLLDMKRLSIGDLRPRALSVSVCDSAVILNTRVERLRRRALTALHLADCARKEMRPFAIHSLHVGVAENESLAVHADLEAARVSWDSLTFDKRCSCETLRWTRQMVAGESAAALTDTQRALVELVERTGFCSGVNGAPQPLADSGAGCPDVPAGGGGGSGVSIDQNIVFYGVIGGAALVAAAALAVLVANRRRLGAALCGRRSPPPAPAAGCGSLLGRRGAGGASAPTSQTDLSSAGRLPDLLRSAPAGRYGPEPKPAPAPAPEPEPEPEPEPAPEHIYAEIRPVLPLSEYADPRDSLALAPAAPQEGAYAEIAPLVPAPPATVTDYPMYGSKGRHPNVTEL